MSPSRRDQGGITILVLGLSLVGLLLVLGTISVTAAQLTRIRVADVADAAALDAADALDEAAYQMGVDDGVVISDATVKAAAEAYLASAPKPDGIALWQVDPHTGTPDGRIAEVSVTGTGPLPVFGPLAAVLGTEFTVTVTASARSDTDP